MNLLALASPLTRVLTLAAFALATASVALAQDAAPEEELPVRVGRLAEIGGEVYVSSGQEAQDWIEALRNYTVTSGDNLWVTAEGRAEIDYGGGQFRLDGDTNVHIARLDDRILALFVAHGRAIVRVRVLDAGEVARIDTPNTQLTITRPGLYRVEVSRDRERTDLVVREGEALVALAAGEQQVLPGQTATVVGVTPDYAEVRAGFDTDGFDQWSAARDRTYERSRTASYVSRQMVGYADLDDHGEWSSYPEYGAVWYPTQVASDWAPYRYGRWTWVGSYGWTWVDDAPWGYAPFHYGRWAYIGSRWGWIPGGYVARPVWAPALVGWYGGSGWSASVSFGAPVYGWVPLGWGEPYRPSWRCSDRCWSRYNRPYAVNHAERPSAPPTRYRNWSAPGGTTAVAGAAFTGRRPVHTNLVPVRNNLANAPVLAQAPAVPRPTATSVPGARPRGNAPPPAERFFRTRPMQAAPGGAVGPGASPTWGGGTSPRTPATSAAPGGVARPSSRALPSQPAATGSRVTAPSGSTGAVPGARPSTATPGTWGAPAATQRAAPQAVPPSRQVRPSSGEASRAIRAPAVNPSSGAAVPRSMAPSKPAAGAVVPRSLPPTRPSGGAVVPRSTLPSAVAPSRPAAVAPARPPSAIRPPAAVAPSRPATVAPRSAAPPPAMRAAPAPVRVPQAAVPRAAPSGQAVRPAVQPMRAAPQGSAPARPSRAPAAQN